MLQAGIVGGEYRVETSEFLKVMKFFLCVLCCVHFCTWSFVEMGLFAYKGDKRLFFVRKAQSYMLYRLLLHGGQSTLRIFM